MNVVSSDAPQYLITTNQATIQIVKMDTLGTDGLIASPNVVMEGESTTLGCGRSCGNAFPKPLSGIPIYTSFYLLGDAIYGVDYVINPVNGVVVNTTPNPPIVELELGVSNNLVTFSLTTFSNCAYGDKTVVFVPQCTYFPGSCYYGPPKWVTNSGCAYMIGQADSILTITHPTTQPTLDTPVIQDAVFQFNINGQVGATYAISTSSNLLNWTDIGTVTMSSCTMMASDLLAGDFAQHFYRARIADSGTVIVNDNLTFQETTPSPSANTMAVNLQPARESASANLGSEELLSPEEQMLLIEAQRLKFEEEGNPEALLLPPTLLTPTFKGLHK